MLFAIVVKIMVLIYDAMLCLIFLTKIIIVKIVCCDKYLVDFKHFFGVETC